MPYNPRKHLEQKDMEEAEKQIMNEKHDTELDELFKTAFIQTVTVREIAEGERMKFHPYWVYVNGKLFCFDFNFNNAKQSILAKYTSNDELNKKKELHKSLCGCPMCDFHVDAYRLQSKDSKGDIE